MKPPGPTNGSLEPISAFSMYKKLDNKHSGKIKKRKPKQKPIAKTSIEVLKTSKIKKQSQKSQLASPMTSQVTKLEHKKSKKRSLKTKEKGQTKEDLETIPKLVKIRSNASKADESAKSLINEEIKNVNPIKSASELFQWLISPLSSKEFFAKFWEAKPVHIKRSNENYYSHILNSTSLDKMLRNNPLFYTRNVDVVSYENGVKEVHNSEGRATPSALWDYYSNGCSIRILNPQSYNHKVHLLISTLQEYFGTMVGANVYLTPPASQGFAPHYDDIEAFVVQLEGRKHWKLYQPKGSDVLARFSSPNLKREDLGEPFMTLTLEAGEVLYFPRGTIHEGCTSEDAHSLHITVSMYQQTSYTNLLEHILPKALKKAADSDVKFRKGLPLNYLKRFGTVNSNSADRENVVECIQDLMHTLVDYIDIDNAADQLGKKLMHDSLPPVLSKSEIGRTSRSDGPYLSGGKVENRVEIDPDTQICLLRYYCIRLVCDDDAAPKLYYNTENANVYHGEEEQWLELDSAMVPAIEKLQNVYPNYIAVEDLPMEDMTLKMQLVADLWEHGILVTDQPLLPEDD